MNNVIKGHEYELYVKHHIINKLNKEAYLWNETPERILLKNNIIGSHNENRIRRIEYKENSLQDTGVDIIQVEENEVCALVQCKNGYKKGVTVKDLAGFMCWIATLDKLKGYIYYTDKLSLAVRSYPQNPRIEYVKLKHDKDDTSQSKFIIVPYHYQIEAKNNFVEKFENRGIISMPCGTGKTYTSFLISTLFKQIIILSPLKQFAKQNLDKYIEYDTENRFSKTLLVDSDGTRDEDEIKKFIQSNESFVISSTFCSVDMIYKNLEYMNNPFVIVDEFHNLSRRNVTNLEDDFYKLLNSNVKILFMSATPRIYDFENNEIEIITKERDIEDSDVEDSDVDDSDVEDSDVDDEYDESLFGSTIYNMSFTEAIDNKYITDYKIWLPSIHENNDKLNKELSIYNIDSKMNAKCNFLFSSLLNNGSRKCIVYNTNTLEIEEMIDAFNKLNGFFNLEYEINVITSNNSAKSREDILKKFEENDKIQLLFSIRILDECIDIPSCDSIFITHPSKNKIRLIQRLSRCIRIDKNNKFKIANVYIWCDQYDEILDTLSGIKEYDIEFKNKIFVNEIDFYGKSDKVELNNDIKLLENYIVGVKEFRQMSWEDKLKEVDNYIFINGRLPSYYDKNIDIKKLGKFINHQKQNYKNNKDSMKNEEIRNKWVKFTVKYEKYFLDNIETWHKNLKDIEEYIIVNGILPSINNKDKNVKKLGSFVCRQKIIYKNNLQIMKNEEIRNKWNKFIEKYQDYFLDNIEIWNNNLQKVEEYIIVNGILPFRYNKNENIKKLGRFISKQKKNYKNNLQIMKNEEIRNKWKKFIEKYQDYFLDNIEIWDNNLKKVEEYIIFNGILPFRYDKNENIKKLGTFIDRQKQNYKDNKHSMKNEEIRNHWENFIKKYEEYFLDNKQIWCKNLKDIEEYIIVNRTLPSINNKDKNVKKLGRFICNEKQNYKDNKHSMKNEEIRNHWENFIKKYEEYFLDKEEIWYNNLNEVKNYIILNNKLPSTIDKDNNIKKLGSFISNQKTNYKNNINIMKNKKIRNHWEKFVKEYL